MLAQGYPAKAVRLIEPFGVGGESDLLARALAQELSALWHRPVTVENITGVGVEAGSALAAKSPADGYTLLVSTNAHAYSAARWQNLPYDPVKDFIPIAALMSQPYVLVTGKTAGVSTVGDLVAAAQAKPAALTFGSSGLATGTHLAAEKFNRAAGIMALHVAPGPTDTFAGAIANLVAGHITYRMMPISFILPQIQSGQLIPLGVSTARRSTLLPEVPTISEAGIAGFDFPAWHGVWAPAGTPASVIEKLAKDIRRVLAGPHLRDWLVRHGGESMAMTQPEFTRFVLGESDSARQQIEPSASQMIVFVCEHGNVKSLIGASFFNATAKERGLPFRAVSRGVTPQDGVPAKIAESLGQDGISVAGFRPLAVTAEDFSKAARVITIGIDVAAVAGATTTPVEAWNDIPPASVDYSASKAALQRHIVELLARLQAGK